MTRDRRYKQQAASSVFALIAESYSTKSFSPMADCPLLLQRSLDILRRGAVGRSCHPTVGACSSNIPAQFPRI
jgi:hypothetical protein